MRTAVSILITTFLVLLGARAQAQRTEPSLWIADDVRNMIYEVTRDGSLLSSFPQVLGANSCSAVDQVTVTLWGTAEAQNRVVNYGKDGTLACATCKPVIDASDFGAIGIEGVDVDPFDDSLWVVDDPEGPGSKPPFVFNIEMDGTLISSFPTSTFDPASGSPQGIAVDPFNGTLWVTDNSSDTVYNVTTMGAPISSFPVSVYTAILDPDVDPNPQGITVDVLNGSLWVTDRATQKIYNITAGRGDEPAGSLISFFDSSTYDALSENPTGIAFDRPLTVVPALRPTGLLALAALLVGGGALILRGRLRLPS